MPKVSVIIPTYNCAKYVCEAIDSVLAQSYKDFEIIIIDDGSRDDTKEALLPYITNGSIKYYYQNNFGPAAARNIGIKKASGELIAFLDADDLWDKEKLSKSLDFIEEHDFNWMCTSLLKVNERGENIIKRISDDSWVLDSVTKEIRQLRNGLFFFASVPVQAQTIMAKRDCFEQVGYFDESFLIGEDTDLWLRFEEFGLRGGYLDEALTIYRYNEKSITKSKKVDGLFEYAKLARKHAIILGLGKEVIRKTYAEVLWKIADDYLDKRRIFKSLKYIMQSLFYNPSNAIRLMRKRFLVPNIKKLSKPNILIYESSSGFGGSANALVNLVKNLDRGRFNPIIVARNFGSQIDKIKDTEIIKLKNTIFDMVVIYSTIKRRKIALLHINNNIIAGIPAIIASKISGIPCICHIRQTRKLIRRERILAKFIDKFVLINKGAVDIYKQDIPADKISVIYDGIDLDEFTPSVNTSLRKEFDLNGSPIIGLVGRIVKGKGHKEFILASKEVVKVKPNAKFLIVGSAKGDEESYYREVVKLTKEEKLNNNVIFTGWRSDIANVISGIDILVQATTTYPEGFGLTIVEAMALKKPVVATNIPGPADIVLDGETGFLVPPNQPDALAKAMIELLSKPDLAKGMGVNGRKRVEELFDAGKNVKKIEELYERILNL